MNKIFPLKATNNSHLALKQISKILPKSYSINTFPVYSGVFEILASSVGYKVTSHTNNFVVGEFWETIGEETDRVIEICKMLEKTIDHETFEIMQKRWFKLVDPGVRTAYFMLLANSSTANKAGSGEYNKETKKLDYTALSGYRNNKITINRNSDNTENFIKEIISKEGCFFYSGEKFIKLANEENKVVGIDDCEINQKEVLQLLKNNYEPWFASFPPSEDLLEIMDKNWKLYPINNNGELCKRDDGRLWLLSNI